MYRFRLSSLGTASVVLALIGLSPAAPADPSVAELLSVCDRASARGNAGQEAAACEWYAAPCPCKFRDPSAPQWCVPESESIDDTVRKVVAELRRYASKSASTDQVVPEILAKLYPCP